MSISLNKTYLRRFSEFIQKLIQYLPQASLFIFLNMASVFLIIRYTNELCELRLRMAHILRHFLLINQYVLNK